MSDQLVPILITSGIALFCTLIWGFSIAFVFWDVNRRELPVREQVGWLALTVIIPFVGFAAYLFARLLNRFLTPHAQLERPYGQRSTAIKRSKGLEEHLPTIAGVELNRENRWEVSSAEQKDSPTLFTTYSLAVVEGPDTGREFAIRSLPLRIGRGPQADIALNEDLGVSRRHAEIYAREDVLYIRDLHSAHGTLVNGFSIDDKSLDPGDRISVGQTSLLLMLDNNI
jgi:hypothetical protein